MNDDERYQWDAIIEQYRESGTLERCDVFAVRSACELWGLYRFYFKAAKANPGNGKALDAVLRCWTKWETAARRLGLNPTDRTRLQPRKGNQTQAVAVRKRS